MLQNGRGVPQRCFCNLPGSTRATSVGGVSGAPPALKVGGDALGAFLHSGRWNSIGTQSTQLMELRVPQICLSADGTQSTPIGSS